MRRTLGSLILVGLMLAAVAAAPVSAGSRVTVHMEVTTTFDPDPDGFWASGIPGCASGWVTDGGAKVLFTPAPGLFLGYKVFNCDEETGFAVRLNARFGPGGAEGTWAIVASWGDLAGIRGAGKLVGEPIDESSILDIYDGAVVL